ncbi:MAG: ComF family protein [Lachnospiraceae bacterium]|nr:ComF family protein [Lachnospiraceae bacterium]
MIDKIRAISEGISRVLYPESCPLCGRVIGGKELCCNECMSKLNPIKSPVCLKCGQEINDQETDCCGDCATMQRHYVKGFPCLSYNQHMAKCLSDFKYHNMRCYSRFLADIIVRERGKEILLASPEVIVPVPVHKSKLRDRGYNQAEVLGAELGRRLKLPVDTGLVLRDSKTTPQKGLSNHEREENLKRAFISSGKIVKYKSALIVDDIYTTGATVEACTRVLQSMGIKEVYYTSVCIGKGY